MDEKFEQRRVRLADLIACDEYEGYFVQRPNESRGEFQRRLSGADSDPGKVRRLVRAKEQGAELPPAVVAKLDGEYLLLDGRHRCSAAAWRGERTVPAIVFHVTSCAEADLISELAFEHSEVGMPWAVSARRIGEALQRAH